MDTERFDNRPIGVFDSGYGGLTVARALQKRLPEESILYFGDSARCPYGPRDQAEVDGFVQQICTWLVGRDVKMIVIACNTATAAGLAHAQENFSVPVVGVVEPGARAAAHTTLNRRVGVIATKGTVDFPASSDTTMGFVFQKTAVFPWKTVMENVELGLQIKGTNKKERREKAQYLIELVGLKGFENAYPYQLSGGMKQRVGIARAYCVNPDILLMDEPFGALDAQTRYQMEEEVLRIWQAEKRTVIFVTNNIEEALFLGDRIVLLSACPAKVKEIYIPRLERPRNNIDPDFLALREEIEANTDLAL